MLRAFTYPFDQVKVLIVGQDPYPTPGHPMGLSFSVHPGVTPIPRSLANIFRELQEDIGCPAPSTGDLTSWSEHGVALFNRVLTVRPGHSGSHRGKGWEEVTECAIKALAERDRPLVAILWGRDAQSTAKWLGNTPTVCSRIHHPYRRAGDSSVHARLAGPMSYWSAKVRNPSNGHFHDELAA